MRLKVPRILTRRASSMAGIAGALGSALLHLVVFGAIAWGGGAPRNPAQERGVGASALASDDPPAGILILLDSPATAPAKDPTLDHLASLGKLLNHSLLTIASPEVELATFDSLENTPSDPSSQDESTGDERGRAALFGLYVRQVQARIERAWMRPAGAPKQDFTCRVQVTQSKRGDVQEVELLTCNGDAPWRLSLVQAIESASPLPAPPDPRVFSDLLRLSFHAEGSAPESARTAPAHPPAGITAAVPNNSIGPRQ